MLRYSSIILILICGACSIANKTGQTNVESFSIEEKQLITSEGADIPMRLYKISNNEDSLLLRTKSSRVDPTGDRIILDRLIDRMLATVTDSASMGVGIAAPQVGILKQVILVQRIDKPDMPFEAYLNPEILDYSENKRPCREGCLSIPNRMDTTTTRSYTITVAYDLMDGAHYKETVEDFTSVIFQHEIDHLNGILYLDHLQSDLSTP